MTTAKNNVSLVSLAIGQFWAFWDFTSNCVAFNVGRADAESWSVPEAQIPPDMFKGYDIAHGAMVAIPIGEAPAMFAQLVAFHESIGEPVPEVWSEIARTKKPAEYALSQRKQRIAAWRATEGSITYKASGRGADGADIDVETTISYRQAADMLAACGDTLPTHFVLSGQRRAYAAPFTVALAEVRRGLSRKEALAFPFMFDVRSVKGKTFTQLQDMLLDENKQNAKAAYSAVGAFVNGYLRMKADPTIGETDLGRMVGLSDTPIVNKRGERQRLHRWLSVQLAHPELNLIPRLNMKPEIDSETKAVKYVAGGYIPAKKLDKEAAAMFLGKTSYKGASAAAQAVRKAYGISGDVPDGAKREATFDEIESYLAGAIAGTSDPDRLTNSDIEAYRTDARLKARLVSLGDVLRAIVAKDKAFFRKLLAEAEREAKSDGKVAGTQSKQRRGAEAK